MQEIVQLRDVFVSYDSHQKDNYTLHALNFSAYSGELIAVIGLSGAGKSTFIKALAGFVEVVRGQASCLGFDLLRARKKDIMKLRRQMGFIFQDYSLVDRLTAIENVLLGRLYQLNALQAFLGLYGKSAYQEAYQLLTSLDLEEYTHTQVRFLSGGQKQRIACARVMHQSPRLILADEPVSSLDETRAQLIMELLRNYTHQYDCACIVNLHDVDLAKSYADRIIGIYEGHIVLDKPARELEASDLELCYS